MVCNQSWKKKRHFQRPTLGYLPQGLKKHAVSSSCISDDVTICETKVTWRRLYFRSVNLCDKCTWFPSGSGWDIVAVVVMLLFDVHIELCLQIIGFNCPIIFPCISGKTVAYLAKRCLLVCIKTIIKVHFINNNFFIETLTIFYKIFQESWNIPL